MKRNLSFALPLALAACFSMRMPREADVRPLTLRVVDAETRAPLAGVEVLWLLETMVVNEGILWGCVPDIHPDRGRKAAFEGRGVTDANGEVTFRLGRVRFDGNERLDRVIAFVNLEADPSSDWARQERTFQARACQEKEVWVPCRGEDYGAYVTSEAIIESPSVLREVLRNPLPAYRGVILSTDNAPQGGDWSLPTDPFRRAWSASSSGGTEPLRVVVALERTR